MTDHNGQPRTFDTISPLLCGGLVTLTFLRKSDRKMLSVSGKIEPVSSSKFEADNPRLLACELEVDCGCIADPDSNSQLEFEELRNIGIDDDLIPDTDESVSVRFEIDGTDPEKIGAMLGLHPNYRNDEPSISEFVRGMRLARWE